MNNATSHQPITAQIGEQPVLPDAIEDVYDAYINGIYDEIEAERANVQAPTLAQKLGLPVFKKLPKNAIISADTEGKDTSGMVNEVIQPSPDLQEALKYAEPAVRIDPEHLVLDSHRINEALADRAGTLAGVGGDTPPEAQIVATTGGYSSLVQGERLIAPIDAIRGYASDVLGARHEAARRVE